MNADSLPEEVNNSKLDGSEEIDSPLPVDAAESNLNSEPSASPPTPVAQIEEVLIPQDTSSPEKIPIIEAENSESETANFPVEPENLAQKEEVLIPQNTSSPEKIPIIEVENSESETENFPIEPGILTSKEEVIIQTTSSSEKIPIVEAENSEFQAENSLVEPATFAQKIQAEKQETFSPISPPSKMRIFVTGASGCIGHYIVERLIEQTDYELYLLVRNPDKLRFDCDARPGIHIVQGDMRNIGQFSQLLKTMNCAILIATAWGGQEAIDVNVFKNIQLLNLLDPKVCQHIIYFSTASVLDRNNQLLKAAGQAGTDYIRSKYDFLRQVSRVPIAKRITTLFPTLVLGGDEGHPYSHISGGLPDLMKETELVRWFGKPLLKVKPIDLIRFFQADASFHFIHAQDIAQVVHYLIEHPPKSEDSQWLVLGNQPMTLNQVIEEACAYLHKRISYRFTLNTWLANFFIYLFRIQMSAWDRFSFNYRHFTYENPVNPATFGLPVYYPTFTDVLKMSKIPRR